MPCTRGIRTERRLTADPGPRPLGDGDGPRNPSWTSVRTVFLLQATFTPMIASPPSCILGILTSSPLPGEKTGSQKMTERLTIVVSTWPGQAAAPGVHGSWQSARASQPLLPAYKPEVAAVLGGVPGPHDGCAHAAPSSSGRGLTGQTANPRSHERSELGAPGPRPHPSCRPAAGAGLDTRSRDDDTGQARSEWPSRPSGWRVSVFVVTCPPAPRKTPFLG